MIGALEFAATSAGLAAGLFALGRREAGGLERARAAVPIRIHVNGMRGKSSTVRLIAAGLFEAGIPALAKATGTAPRVLAPDEEAEIARGARPNIIEQADFLRHAAAEGARAVVIECMALRPDFQSVCELSIIRSTHGVITNAGPDHLDVMGPAVEDVARALAGTVPVNGRLFTSESPGLTVFREAARDRGSSVVVVGEREIANVSVAGFPHREHPVNVALALAVLADLGIPRETALRGFAQKLHPDPGATTVHTIRHNGARVTFVNAFGANDRVSSGIAWRSALRDFPDTRWKMIVISCRHDRPARTADLADAAHGWPRADRYAAIGPDARRFLSLAARAGWPCVGVPYGTPAATWPDRVMDGLVGDGLIVGLGNSAGGGLDFAAAIAAREVER